MGIKSWDENDRKPLNGKTDSGHVKSGMCWGHWTRVSDCDQHGGTCCSHRHGREWKHETKTWKPVMETQFVHYAKAINIMEGSLDQLTEIPSILLKCSHRARYWMLKAQIQRQLRHHLPKKDTSMNHWPVFNNGNLQMLQKLDSLSAAS